MDKPVTAPKTPIVTDLEAGTYYWWAWGLSKNQPYCEGSHEGTGESPVEFKLEKKKRVALCPCRKTSNAPFCDGAHKDL